MPVSISLSKSLRKTLLTSVMLLATTTAQAQSTSLTSLDILQQFNNVTSGTFSSTQHVEGRMVANSMTNVNGAVFNMKPGSSTSAFAAVNAITVNQISANINNGGSLNYINSYNPASSINFNGNGTLKKASPAFAISDFTNPLNTLSTQLAGLTSNSSILNPTDQNTFTFNVTPVNGIAVFNLSTTALDIANDIKFNNLQSANTVIINVTGTSFTGANNNSGTYANTHVIWNFINATNLDFSSWHGAILAKDATVTNSSSLEGLLYSKNFDQRGELHEFAFAGTLPNFPVSAVPEPSTYLMYLAGLMILLSAHHFQRSRKIG